MVADKLTTIAEKTYELSEARYSFGYTNGHNHGWNQGWLWGYEAGEEYGWADGYEYGWVDGVDEGRAEGYENGLQYGIYKGKQQENELFWRNFWNGLKKSDGSNYRLSYAFCGGGWNFDNFSRIIYPFEHITITGSTTSNYVFASFNRNYDSTTPMIDLSEFCQRVDFSQCTNVTGMFMDARAKNITVDFSNTTTLLNTFSGGNGGDLDNITVKVTNKCTTFSSAFTYQDSLREIRFTEDSEITNSISFAQSSALSDESIQSIIDALGVVTSTKKITFHSAIVDRLTDEQSQQIVNKGWEIG